MAIGLLGKKLGMTRVYDDKGRSIPVTVIEASGNRILQTKTEEKDGYRAVQVGYADQKPQRVTKPLLKHFEKTESTPKRFIREFRLEKEEIAPESADLAVSRFEVGQYVDVIGTSKGRGFAGVMKRHNYHGQGASHGSKIHRATGSVGQCATPGRISKNQGMPGHYGVDRITVQNLEIIQMRAEDGVILVKGSIAGANGGYVVIRPAKKKGAATTKS